MKVLHGRGWMRVLQGTIDSWGKNVHSNAKHVDFTVPVMQHGCSAKPLLQCAAYIPDNLTGILA